MPNKRKCSHCQLEFEEKFLFLSIVNGEEKYFCCRGCEGVYRLLYSQGLESFYNKLGNNTLQSFEEAKDNLEIFDTQSFFDKYVVKRDSLYEISLILERIHCIACVWLNEKILSRQKGIIKVSINYTTNKATLLFDLESIKISEIIAAIRSIGYDAHIYDSRLQEQYAQKQKRDYYIRLSVGIFCVMNIMWIAVAQYAGYFSGISLPMRNILNVAGFALSTPVLFFSGWVFWRGAYFALKHKTPNMDLLVISGATLAYLYSIYASFKGVETYFESVAMIITFVLIGKFLEVRGKKSAVDSLDKINAQIPLSVNVLRGDRREEVSVYDIKIGEIIEAKPGERIALDGNLLSLNALCDESALNGESLPIQKQYQDKILSGSLVLNTPLCYQVSKEFKDSLMTSIVNMVEESLNFRPQIQEQANKIARFFSLVMFFLGFMTFLGWFYYLGASFDKSLMIAISVIIIACPCALALATPIACLVGLGRAIEKKILFKEARFLETIAKANTLVLDKTGTLTQGNLKVVEIKSNATQEELNILAKILSQSSHPISQAVLKILPHSDSSYVFDTLEQVNARGMIAKIGEDIYLGGNFELLEEEGIAIPQEIYQIQSDKSIFCFAKNKTFLSFYALEDCIKEDAFSALEEFRKMGIALVLLSGDNEGVCKKVSQALGIKEYYAKQSPIDKANFIDKLHKEGKVVVMVGDGINDSIALGKSDIGIAMGGGIDLAISVSDIVILDDRVEGVKEAFYLGSKTYAFIKQNLWLSLIYNALTIPLAMFGFVIPLVAALSMSLSSLVVVLNSMRLKRNE
ncbi:MAG: heavy metal translocating P-type ATPase [Helicobacter sp.]|nr:heavy metal translocating P-type ATPase [Helicobacter sp.]